MKFDELTKEQIEMFFESPFNEGNSVEYGLYWSWDWETLELITEDSQGFISVYLHSSEDELSERLSMLESNYRDWLDSIEY